MEDARATSFEKGKIEGARIAREGIEQRTEMLVQGIAANMAQLELAEDARKQQFNDDSILLTYHALRAVFPDLLRQAAETEIKAALHRFMDQASTKTAFTLHVHPDMIEPLGKHVTAMHANMTVIAEPALPLSAARIEWEKGAAEWAPETIAGKILDHLRALLPAQPERLDGKAKKPHNEPEQDA